MCRKCGKNHGLHPLGMLGKKNPNASFKKGRTAWNKGLTKFDSLSMMRISNFMKSDGNPMKRPEQRARMRGQKYGLGHTPWNVGLNKNSSDKTLLWCEKNSNAHMLKWKNPIFRVRMIKSIVHASHKRPTDLELLFMNFIDKYHLPFRYVGDGSLIINGKNPDFIDEKNGVVVEVYNVFWKNKNYGSVANYKRIRRAVFNRCGFKTVFLSNDDFKGGNWVRDCLIKLGVRND